jgi:universal stress protein A
MKPARPTAANFDSLYSHGFVRAAVGIPSVKVAEPLYNTERLLGLAPNYREFYEKRQFTAGRDRQQHRHWESRLPAQFVRVTIGKMPGGVPLCGGRPGESTTDCAWTNKGAFMKATLSRILVPTDFGPSSDAALDYAKLLAEPFGASLHLLHILEQPNVAGAWGSEVYLQELPGIRQAAQQEAQARLDQALTPSERDRFRASIDIVDGQVAETIVETALKSKCDLIIMGTHGRRGVAHLLLGSVAEKVARTASCPVLIVRGGEQTSNPAA